MMQSKEYAKYFKPIGEDEMKDWRPSPKGFSTKLFEAFLNSSDEMVAVNIAALPEPKHRKGSKGSTKQDSFASSFYAWKRKKSTKDRLKKLGREVLLIRRGGKIALKKKRISR